MKTMKALSIMQPYAWLIVEGHKDIENRDWQERNHGRKFRGEVLIHTGLRYYGNPREWDFEGIERPQQFPMGGIVGIAEIVDVVTESTSPWFYGPLGLVIRNARPLPFLPLKGQLGFFNVELPEGYLS